MIRRELNRRGYDIIRCTPSETWRRTIDVFGLVIEDYMRKVGRRDLSFVQIGANDGATADPLFQYIFQDKWRGIAVEPQTELAALARKNYKAPSRVIVEQCAIADYNGICKLYRFANWKQGDHRNMLASFNEKAIGQHPFGYQGETEEITVPCMTLETLFEKHGITTLDVFQVDTEGEDGKILRQLFEQTTVRPAIIQFESGGVASPELKPLEDLLDRTGYACVSVGIDTICYRSL